jgi:hypothetical protein
MTEQILTSGISAHQQNYGLAMAEDLIRMAHHKDIITFRQLNQIRRLMEETWPSPTYEEMDVERTILQIISGEADASS